MTNSNYRTVMLSTLREIAVPSSDIPESITTKAFIFMNSYDHDYSLDKVPAIDRIDTLITPEWMDLVDNQNTTDEQRITAAIRALIGIVVSAKEYNMLAKIIEWCDRVDSIKSERGAIRSGMMQFAIADIEAAEALIVKYATAVISSRLRLNTVILRDVCCYLNSLIHSTKVLKAAVSRLTNAPSKNGTYAIQELTTDNLEHYTAEDYRSILELLNRFGKQSHEKLVNTIINKLYSAKEIKSDTITLAYELGGDCGINSLIEEYTKVLSNVTGIATLEDRV